MIDKREFYHGAALVRLLEHPSCESVKRWRNVYVVNGETVVMIKYTTKHRSPWRFTFSQDDVRFIGSMLSSRRRLIVAFVNGGDGITALTTEEVHTVLGDDPGWISMARKFHEQYAAAGSHGTLAQKCSVSRWPIVAFQN